jgi:hypothetical protein
MPTITAGFNDFDMAVKAGGALLDHGIRKDQFDLLAGRAHEGHFHAEGRHLEDLEQKVQSGVTTTTRHDAAEGAKKGLGAGAVLGALAGLASLFIPGYGVVVGGGALATAIGAAIGAAVGTAAGGAVAGGATGYLEDMGVDEEAASDFDRTIRNDGAIIVVHITTGGTTETEIRQILEKYQAVRIHSTEQAVL